MADTRFICAAQPFDVRRSVEIYRGRVFRNLVRQSAHHVDVTAPRLPHLERDLVRRCYPITLLHEVEHRPNAMVCDDGVRTADAGYAQDPRDRCQLEVGKVTRRCTVEEAEHGRDAKSLPITAGQEAEIRVAVK